MLPIIETERLILRLISVEDLEGIYSLDVDPIVHQYLGKRPITTVSQAQEIIDYIQSQYENDGIGRYGVIEKKSGDFVGWAGLKYEIKVRDEMNYYDLGYRFRQQFWGRGYATEASIACLKLGFEKLELSEIYAGAHVNNIASNRVLEKLGFKLLEVFVYDTEPHNWYQITKASWKAIMKKSKIS